MHESKSLSPEWLRSRINLFENYCLPSVISQTVRPDVWLLLFDSETPKEIADLVDWHLKFDFVRPVFVNGPFSQAIAVELTNKYKDGKSNWLLTTRLDSDDALNSLFIEKLQSEVVEGQREFLNMNRGLIAANGKFYRKKDFSNPFISLSESAHSPTTVWIDQHHRLNRHGRVRQISLRDSWIQLIHGGNVANQIRGVRVPISSIDGTTLPPALVQGLNDERFIDLFIDNTYGLFTRYWGSLIRFIRTKIRDAKQPNTSINS